MITNKDNGFSVLPFYDSISEQHANQSFVFGNIFHNLFVNKHALIPFQAQLKTTATGVDSVYFRNDQNERVTGDISGDLISAGLHFVDLSGVGLKVLVYPASVPLVIDILEGLHYLEIILDNDEAIYSEMFTVVNDTSCYLKLEWYDLENMNADSGSVIYSNTPIMPQFKNVMYIASEIGRPEYPYDEEVQTRDMYVFPEKKLSAKQYKFSFTAPEFLCDALRFVMLADKVTIYEGSKTHEIDTITITPRFLDRADLAAVEVEFRTNTIIKKIGKNYLSRNRGDFNSDYNVDFDIS